LFTRDLFRRMRPAAILINVTRGAIVYGDDLLTALNDGLIWGAGLDVTDPEPLPPGHPLWTHPRVIITPHTAGGSPRRSGRGVVAARGPGVSEDEAPTGARVMNHHYKGCGRCKHCRVGWSQLCPNGIVVYGMTGHGGHAPYMKVPARTLVPLPDALSFEEGAAVSCGTGTAYGALKRLDVSGRDTLAVFGQGPVGLSATMLGRAMGARVI